jgi:hypothetical protein
MIMFLLLATVRAAYSQSYAWIAEGDRLDNDIVRLLIQEDTSSALGVVKALALRDDQYVEDIIRPLLVQLDKDREVLLESYLQGVLGGGEDRARDWGLRNPSLLDGLVRCLGEFRRTHLRGAVLRLAAHGERADLASYLAAFATDIVADKLLTQPSVYETLALLEAISSTASADLAMLVISVGRSSRNSMIVKEARLLAAELLR